MAGTSLPFIDFSMMLKIVAKQQSSVLEKLSAIKKRASSISIADMFDLQMQMNKLSQFSEMSTSVVGAANSAISTMARGIKQ